MVCHQAYLQNYTPEPILNCTECNNYILEEKQQTNQMSIVFYLDDNCDPPRAIIGIAKSGPIPLKQNLNVDWITPTEKK